MGTIVRVSHYLKKVIFFAMYLLNKLFKTFGTLAMLVLAFVLAAYGMYWVFKTYSQIYKVVLRFFKINYPFGMKLKSQVTIGSLTAVISVFCFEYLISKGNDVFLLLPIIPATLLLWSAMDKAILQNEMVCSWFNPKRIWCA